jgi:hypothetical protein
MKLSIVVPTIGRSTLRRTLDVLTLQMGPEDEAFIVADGPNASRRILADWYYWWRRRLPMPSILYMETAPTGHYGCEQIDFAIPQMTGDMMYVMSDDDTYPDDALANIREGVGDDFKSLHIFACKFFKGSTLQNSTECGQVTGQQVVTPVSVAKQIRYADCQKRWDISDWFWVHNALTKCKSGTFHSTIIAELNKHNQGRMT